MGAALLAHPMSMAVLVLAGPAVVFVTGLGTDLRKSTARGMLAGTLGVALVATLVGTGVTLTVLHTLPPPTNFFYCDSGVQNKVAGVKIW